MSKTYKEFIVEAYSDKGKHRFPLVGEKLGYVSCSECGTMWLGHKMSPCPVCKPAVALGKLGGASKSAKKQAASRKNGQKGGRPAKKGTL